MKATYKAAAILFFVLFIGIFYFLKKPPISDVNIPSTYNQSEINFNDIGETIYVRAKSWGIVGGTEEIIISNSNIKPNRKYIAEKEYIFYTSEIYYEKKGRDTLLVFANASSVGKLPEEFPSQIKVVIYELKNYDQLRDYEKNYLKYGLSKISVYQ